MEWDQYVFYKGSKIWRALKKKIKSKNPYFEYNALSEEIALQKFLILMRNRPIVFLPTGNKLRFNYSAIKFPERITWFYSENVTKCFIRFLLSYISYILNERENLSTFDQKSNPTFFFLNFRKFMHQFPGVRREWKLVRNEILAIKKKDYSHYVFLRTLLSTITQNFEVENLILLEGKEYTSDQKKSQIKPKESKLKIDISKAELLEVDEKKIEEYTLGHNFEKIETVEEFDGQWRDIDGEEDMEEEEALQELNVKHVIRTEDPVHTTRSSDMGSGTLLEIKDVVEIGKEFKYPEWDYNLKKYKPKFCSVFEDTVSQVELGYSKKIFDSKHASLVKLKKNMMVLLNQTRIKKRLISGSEIDLNALVDRYADLKAKKTPSELIYMNPVRDISDIVIFFLIDLSLSTDSWIDDKRILDIEKESLLIFSESLNELQIPFGIAGFYSRTRNHNKYIHIKKLNESWLHTKDRLGPINSVGYTRVGPSLRHTNFILKNTAYKQKWIVLLTDGRPNDYDRYEGKYGIEDVNKAVNECKLNGVNVYTLAIGTEEKPTIPAMMRNASYQMLFHPERLIDSLNEFFRKVIGSNLQ